MIIRPLNSSMTLKAQSFSIVCVMRFKHNELMNPMSILKQWYYDLMTLLFVIDPYWSMTLKAQSLFLLFVPERLLSHYYQKSIKIGNMETLQESQKRN